MSLLNDRESMLALGQSLERGATLPAQHYTSKDVFEREQDRIFRHAWQYVALTSQLATPGDFVTARLGHVPIVIVRDEAERLSAYVNVCGHRGSELVLAPSGNRKTLQCHYHAWTWGLDGRLRSAPCAREQQCFDKDAFPLVRLPVDTFGPFVFVNPDPNASPLARVLGELPQLIAETGADFRTLERRERRTYDIAANWKVVVENFLECYHCAVAHPQFTSLIDLDRYKVIPHEYFSIQRGPLKVGAPRLYDVADGGQEGLYNYVWPNFMVNVYPGPGNASTNLVVPISEDRTLAVYEFFYSDRISVAESDKMTALIDQVQQEDIVICESVQRGLRSGFYQQGQLMLTRENGIQHFQRLVHRHLSEPS